MNADLSLFQNNVSYVYYVKQFLHVPPTKSTYIFCGGMTKT